MLAKLIFSLHVSYTHLMYNSFISTSPPIKQLSMHGWASSVSTPLHSKADH